MRPAPKPSGPPPPVRAAMDHFRAGRLKPAIELLRPYLRHNPDDANAQFLLGIALSQDLQDEPALYALERAAAMRPNEGQRWVVLGLALQRIRGPESAIAMLRRVPPPAAADLEVQALLAEELFQAGQSAEAVPMLRALLAKNPGHHGSLRSLAKILSISGKPDEALELFKRAATSGELRNLAVVCFHANYSDTLSPAAVFESHKHLFDAAAKAVPPSPQNPAGTPARARREGEPLRVAFLSADLQQHSVTYFLEPILEELDRSRFRCICMPASAIQDEVTARLRQKSDEWVDASSQDPATMVEVIRGAKPDILIELGGLTGPARVLAFAHRIAPVQATYLGYPNTSGVPNVDFRLVDAITDPAEPYQDGTRPDGFATEKLQRIEGCFICYRPPDDAPPVAARPAEAPLTFGSFNTAHKMSPRCVRLWSGLMKRVPGSRLVLKRKEFADPWVAGQFIEAFGREGIDAGRLKFLGKTPSVAEHLASYTEMDIALDTFPYHGTTTTCEALWMGVPVVSLIGQTHASRVGLSLLTAVGLERFAAGTEEQFASIGAELTSGRAALAAMRAGMRERVRGSMLCDRRAFARRFERALESMWKAHARDDGRPGLPHGLS